MKICIVAYKFGTEKEIGEHLGTYHYFIEITRHLADAGHQVSVIAPWLSFTKKGSQNINGVKILRYYPILWNNVKFFPLNRVIRYWYIKATQRMVLKFDKREKPDIIFVWQARETGYAVSKIKNKLQAPFIFRQITTWQWHFKRDASEIYGKRDWHKKLQKIKLDKLANMYLEFLLDRKTNLKYAQTIYKQADRVVFVSKVASLEALEMDLEQSKVEILPVVIETDLFKPLNRKNELRQELNLKGNKILLFIGRINFAEKGIGYLLNAMLKIISQIPNVNLIIIGGGGESQRMFEMIKELNIEKNVQAVGKKPFESLVKYINASDVFMMTSVWLETFGQVTIEAMSCGIPVVGFDAGATPYINLDGETGFIVPSKDVDALAEATIKILNDDELKEKMGRTARQRVIENYTYQVLINKFLEIVKNVRK